MNNIKNELLKVISLLDQEQQTTFKQIQEVNYKHSKSLNDRIVELEAELAVVNLALRNAENDAWLGHGFQMSNGFLDMCAKKAIERARKQLNTEKEQS